MITQCGRAYKFPLCHSAGDGVNDVEAMKSADAAVALLNGFGAESVPDEEIDHDEERRRERLAKRKIGSNRSSHAGAPRSTLKGPAHGRLQAAIEKAHKRIAERAAARQGLETDSNEIQYTMTDLKDIISGTMKAAWDERRRAKQLQKGGGKAARILAEDARSSSKEEDKVDNMAELESIKPGEASLVAPFSCLRPSIAGVESILRAGLASAACSLSTQQTIVLNSLMSSFNLASLYRDGFRYGNRMWQIEMTLYILVNRASYVSSITPRPRLPSSMVSRPPSSMFHPSYVISTIAQAVVHLVSITVGVLYGKVLEVHSFRDAQVTKRAPRIRAVQLANNPQLVQLATAILAKLEAIDFQQEETSKADENRGIFRRQPFRPNYETNIAFIFSLIQSVISSLVNHKGKPFYGSILESRELCKYAGLTMLFSIACITESFPWMNRMLELRRLPSRKSKLIILSIATLNAMACVLIRVLTDLLLPRDLLKSSTKGEYGSTVVAVDAADEEEKLLREESQHNKFMVLVMLALGANLIFDAALRRV
jgi:manganese-transporting P-type ATPase